MACHAKKGLKTNARIAFLDESGISERPSVRRTWGIRGHTPIISSTGSWQTRSVIGIITCTPRGDAPRLYIRIFAGAIRQEHEILFLKEFRRYEPGVILLVWDRLAAHRSKSVREYLASVHGFSAEHFPSYAPELNPVEYVWATAKNHDLANLYPQGLTELDRHIRNMKKRLKRRSDLLTGFLRKSSLFC